MKLLLFVLINTFAAFFQGAVGFGQALIASPLSLTILSKGTVLTALVIAGLVLNASLARKAKEPLDTKIFKPLIVGSVLGMPCGIVLLKVLPLGILTIVVGGLSILFALSILFVKVKVHHIRKLSPVVGLICGVLQTSTGMPGPIAILLFSGSDLSKDVTRKILFTFFFWSGIISIPLFLVSRVLTLEGIVLGVCVVPFVVLGGNYGHKISAAVPHRWYKAIALGTVCLTGVYAIYTGLMRMWH